MTRTLVKGLRVTRRANRESDTLAGMDDFLLHNPACSKSRAALDLVREAGVDLPVREYLRDPLTVEELRSVVDLLGVRPIEIARRGEPQFAALGLHEATPDDEVLQAMAAHPILIERPIVVSGGKAVMGRPVERVRELLRRSDER
jgi:arsenate reductase